MDAKTNNLCNILEKLLKDYTEEDINAALDRVEFALSEDDVKQANEWFERKLGKGKIVDRFTPNSYWSANALKVLTSEFNTALVMKKAKNEFPKSPIHNVVLRVTIEDAVHSVAADLPEFIRGEWKKFWRDEISRYYSKEAK